MSDKGECPICGTDSIAQRVSDMEALFFVCPTCGRFEYSIVDYREFDRNIMSSYLFYNSFRSIGFKTDLRFHTSRSQEYCDGIRDKIRETGERLGVPVHMDKGIVDGWYPKSINEKIDRILLFLVEKTNHIGSCVDLSFSETLSLTFVDRFEVDINQNGEPQKRDSGVCRNDAHYMLDYLKSTGLIDYDNDKNDMYHIRVLPDGLSRVDHLQKTGTSCKNAFVAMKFGNETLHLREAIKKGILDAGYVPVLIDDVEHNNNISVEILKHIRDSRFLVVDLSHQNNGAYYEAGYARGLEKPVIQLCKKDVKMHFDIAQINTIIWEDEDDIPERLKNRIAATID